MESLIDNIKMAVDIAEAADTAVTLKPYHVRFLLDNITSYEKQLDQLESENAALRERVAKWENWKPDNDDLLTMREQAESAKSLAAYAAYVGMLEYKYREQQERVAELEAEIAAIKQDRTTGAGYQTFTVAR